MLYVQEKNTLPSRLGADARSPKLYPAGPVNLLVIPGRWIYIAINQACLVIGGHGGPHLLIVIIVIIIIIIIIIIIVREKLRF